MSASEIRLFAKLVLHGDDEHRGWLLEAAERFIAGEPMPEPRGKGKTEAALDAAIAALQSENARMRAERDAFAALIVSAMKQRRRTDYAKILATIRRAAEIDAALSAPDVTRSAP